MIGCLPTQALAFLAVFVYATHATQAIAFEWKPGFCLSARQNQNGWNYNHQHRNSPSLVRPPSNIRSKGQGQRVTKCKKSVWVMHSINCPSSSFISVLLLISILHHLPHWHTSFSSPSLSSPITPSLFHSFHKSFPLWTADSDCTVFTNS